uniref:Uncharacterized protein n=1 Tax=Leersia perrieri TaxID=77586 RepID=A0A0D9X5B1_9ORYZ
MAASSPISPLIAYNPHLPRRLREIKLLQAEVSEPENKMIAAPDAALSIFSSSSPSKAPSLLLSLFERLDQAGTDDGGVTCYGGDVPKLTVGCKGGVSVCNF